jgi:hypothetical protein
MTITVLVNDVRDRIMELCELIVLPDPLTTGTAYRDEKDCELVFPSYVVKAGARGNQYEYSDSQVSYITQREFRIGLYVAEICDESYKRDMDMVDLCETITQTVVDFFAARPTLIDAEGNDLVDLARVVDSTAPHTMPPAKLNKVKNRGIQFRMVVRFLNFARQT